MKIICSTLILAITISTVQLMGQERSPSESISYSYELVQERVNTPGDTIFGVYLLLDSVDISGYTKVVMNAAKLEREVPIQTADLLSNQNIEKQDRLYRIYMQEWSVHEPWLVSIQTPDGSRIVLKDAQKELLKEPNRISLKPITTDVRISEVEEIHEEEKRSVIKDNINNQ